MIIWQQVKYCRFVCLQDELLMRKHEKAQIRPKCSHLVLLLSRVKMLYYFRIKAWFQSWDLSDCLVKFALKRYFCSYYFFGDLDFWNHWVFEECSIKPGFPHWAYQPLSFHLMHQWLEFQTKTSKIFKIEKVLTSKALTTLATIICCILSSQYWHYNSDRSLPCVTSKIYDNFDKSYSLELTRRILNSARLL